MDRVFIEGLEVDTVIGAYDWERGIRQCLRLDLSFAWDNRPAAAGDDLTLALDYASVSARIQAFAAESQARAAAAQAGAHQGGRGRVLQPVLHRAGGAHQRIGGGVRESRRAQAAG